MEFKDILFLLGGGLSSPVLLKLLDYLRSQKQAGETSHKDTLEDKTEFIRLLMEELKVLKQCARELEEENLKLERRLYRMEVSTAERKAFIKKEQNGT